MPSDKQPSIPNYDTENDSNKIISFPVQEPNLNSPENKKPETPINSENTPEKICNTYQEKISGQTQKNIENNGQTIQTLINAHHESSSALQAAYDQLVSRLQNTAADSKESISAAFKTFQNQNETSPNQIIQESEPVQEIPQTQEIPQESVYKDVNALLKGENIPSPYLRGLVEKHSPEKKSQTQTEMPNTPAQTPTEPPPSPESPKSEYPKNDKELEQAQKAALAELNSVDAIFENWKISQPDFNPSNSNTPLPEGVSKEFFASKISEFNQARKKLFEIADQRDKSLASNAVKKITEALASGDFDPDSQNTSIENFFKMLDIFIFKDKFKNIQSKDFAQNLAFNHQLNRWLFGIANIPSIPGISESPAENPVLTPNLETIPEIFDQTDEEEDEKEDEENDENEEENEEEKNEEDNNQENQKTPQPKTPENDRKDKKTTLYESSHPSLKSIVDGANSGFSWENPSDVLARLEYLERLLQNPKPGREKMLEEDIAEIKKYINKKFPEYSQVSNQPPQNSRQENLSANSPELPITRTNKNENTEPPPPSGPKPPETPPPPPENFKPIFLDNSEQELIDLSEKIVISQNPYIEKPPTIAETLKEAVGDSRLKKVAKLAGAVLDKIFYQTEKALTSKNPGLLQEITADYLEKSKKEWQGQASLNHFGNFFIRLFKAAEAYNPQTGKKERYLSFDFLKTKEHIARSYDNFWKFIHDKRELKYENRVKNLDGQIKAQDAILKDEKKSSREKEKAQLFKESLNVKRQAAENSRVKSKQKEAKHQLRINTRCAEIINVINESTKMLAEEVLPEVERFQNIFISGNQALREKIESAQKDYDQLVDEYKNLSATNKTKSPELGLKNFFSKAIDSDLKGLNQKLSNFETIHSHNSVASAQATQALSERGQSIKERISELEGAIREHINSQTSSPENHIALTRDETELTALQTQFTELNQAMFDARNAYNQSKLFIESESPALRSEINTLNSLRNVINQENEYSPDPYRAFDLQIKNYLGRKREKIEGLQNQLQTNITAEKLVKKLLELIQTSLRPWYDLKEYYSIVGNIYPQGQETAKVKSEKEIINSGGKKNTI